MIPKLIYFTASCFLSSLAVCQSPKISVIVSPVGSGQASVTINNLYTQKLSAYVITSYQDVVLPSGQTHRISGRRYQDSAVTASQMPVPPGAGTTISREGVNAAVFEDGTSFGDPQAILQRRRAYIEAVDMGLQDLTAATVPKTASALAQQLKASWDQKRASAQALARADAAAANPGSLNTLGESFQESTRVIQATNMKIFAGEDRVECLKQVYNYLIVNLNKAPSRSDGTQLSLDETIRIMTDTLIHNRAAVASSKPPLA
jgi:hypothetical protein